MKRPRPRLTAERAKTAEKTFLCVLGVLGGCLLHAQQTTRLGVLQAEDRRAATPRDLATIRAGARSGDPQTARVGVRALGRLERPALIPDILPALRNEFPEVRVEAANAVGQAAQGWKGDKPPAAAPSIPEHAPPPSPPDVDKHGGTTEIKAGS